MLKSVQVTPEHQTQSARHCRRKSNEEDVSSQEKPECKARHRRGPAPGFVCFPSFSLMFLVLNRQTIRPHMRSFLHAVQKNQVLMMTPNTLGRSGVIKSFIKHTTPLRIDPKVGHPSSVCVCVCVLLGNAPTDETKEQASGRAVVTRSPLWILSPTAERGCSGKCTTDGGPLWVF